MDLEGFPTTITAGQLTEALRILGLDAGKVYDFRVGRGLAEVEVWCPVFARSDQFPNTHRITIKVVPDEAPEGEGHG